MKPRKGERRGVLSRKAREIIAETSPEGAVTPERRQEFSHLSTVLAVKLGSIVVHADEFTGEGGVFEDEIVLRRLIEDRDVQAWLKSFPPALLPVKRG